MKHREKTQGISGPRSARECHNELRNRAGVARGRSPWEPCSRRPRKNSEPKAPSARLHAKLRKTPPPELMLTALCCRPCNAVMTRARQTIMPQHLATRNSRRAVHILCGRPPQLRRLVCRRPLHPPQLPPTMNARRPPSGPKQSPKNGSSPAPARAPPRPRRCPGSPCPAARTRRCGSRCRTSLWMARQMPGKADAGRNLVGPPPARPEGDPEGAEAVGAERWPLGSQHSAFDEARAWQPLPPTAGRRLVPRLLMSLLQVDCPSSSRNGLALNHPITHSVNRSLAQSPESLNHRIMESLNHSVMQSLSHSNPQSLSHSRTHSLTRSASGAPLT